VLRTTLQRAQAPENLLMASVVVYLACLPFNSFCVSEECGNWPGWGVLIMGWMELILHAEAGVSWLANPIVFVAWASIFFRWRISALVFSVTALLLAIWFLGVDEVIVDEGGAWRTVTGYAAGYWLWLVSILLAVTAAWKISPVKAVE